MRLFNSGTVAVSSADKQGKGVDTEVFFYFFQNPEVVKGGRILGESDV